MPRFFVTAECSNCRTSATFFTDGGAVQLWMDDHHCDQDVALTPCEEDNE